MSTVTLLELQQQPTAVFERIRSGERLVVIRDGQAVAELRPVPPATLVPRTRGRCAGLFRVPDDFDSPLPEDILREFEGR